MRCVRALRACAVCVPQVEKLERRKEEMEAEKAAAAKADEPNGASFVKNGGAAEHSFVGGTFGYAKLDEDSIHGGTGATYGGNGNGHGDKQEAEAPVAEPGLPWLRPFVWLLPLWALFCSRGASLSACVSWTPTSMSIQARCHHLSMVKCL